MRIAVQTLVALLLISSVAWAQLQDSGRFALRIQGESIGDVRFTDLPDGGSESKASVHLGETTHKMTITVKIKEDRPCEITIDAGKNNRITLIANNGKGLVNIGGKTKDIQLPPKFGVFANFAPNLDRTILDLYNASAGGSQSIPAYLVDSGTILNVKLSRLKSNKQMVAGREIAVTDWRLEIAGIAINLLADSSNRVLAWDVPSQKFTATREGFAGVLAKPAVSAVDRKLSQPIYQTKVTRKTMIPMRDGVRLAADITRPNKPGKFSVILIRTPYSRKTIEITASYFAKRGYAVIAQDVRGKFDSGGRWEPFVNEPRDGYDTIEWAARQPWSNGKVGMIGASYAGWVQWMAAREGSKHLKAIIPQVSPADPFFNIPYNYGTLFLAPAIWWSSIVDTRTMSAPPKFTDWSKFKVKPLTQVDRAVLNKTVGFFQTWLKHPTFDSYWKRFAHEAYFPRINVPALHISGWFDGDGIGTKRNYAGMKRAKKPHQKLIYGPWSHAFNTTTKLGVLEFGEGSIIDLDNIYLRWFDRWLKGIRNGIETEPSVDAFLMGANEWRQYRIWPPGEAKPTKFFLRGPGPANAHRGSGTLSTTPPKNEAPDRYSHDPRDPVFFDVPMDDETSQPQDMKRFVSRPDVLSYITPPLVRDLDVMGEISVRLFAASSAKDTDWGAILSDVFPDGRVIPLVNGIIRARFRKSWSKPSLLKPGEVFAYDLDLWALGHRFARGHRVRLDLCSSIFPIADVNSNTGANPSTDTKAVVARQTIYHDSRRPSHVLLPILSRKGPPNE